MKARDKHPVRILWRIFSGLALAAALAVAGAMLLAPALGYERYVITGGSMAGTYDRGSIVFAKTVPVSELRVGDVITYSPPPGTSPDERVTHRIASIDRSRRGRTVLRTKGDANAAPDPWQFTLDRPNQARAELDLPYAGFALMALSERVVRILLIGLPALLLAVGLIGRLWRDAGAELRRRREASA